MEEKITEVLVAFVDEEDISKITIKSAKKAVNRALNVDIRPYKKYIKLEITRLVKKQLQLQDGKEEKEENNETGLKRKVFLSKKLTKFFDGLDKESRPQVVSKLWKYIKKHNLQDPADKRFILSDKKLYKLFKRKRFSGFRMNKYLKEHIRSSLNDDFPEPYFSSEENEKEQLGKRKRKRKRSSTRDVSNYNKNGFTLPIPISRELSIFFQGRDKMARTQVVKGLWQYIKENSLQDPKDRRTIICDRKLKSLLGVKELSCFHLSKHIQKHFVK